MRVDLEKFHNMEFLSVTSLNRYINYKFDSDIHLQEVYLRGEISNFKTSGRHAYFSLKDEYSVISAMIFNYQMLNIDFPMEDGIIVQVVGTIKVYEKRGSYSIVINHIERDGIGRLYQEFLELKEMREQQALANELSSKLWKMANELRGTMEAYEFKSYILGLIFYKFLSDKTEDEMNEALKNDGITYQEAWEDEEIINEGDYAIITSIEGNKLHVKRKE